MTKSNSKRAQIEQVIELFRTDKFQQTLDCIDELPKEFDDNALLLIFVVPVMLEWEC